VSSTSLAWSQCGGQRVVWQQGLTGRRVRGTGGVPRGPGDIAPHQTFEQPAPAEREVDPEEEKEKVRGRLRCARVPAVRLGLGRLRESGPGGLTREVETPCLQNSPHDHMILRVEPGGLTWEVERSLPSNSPHDHMTLRVELVGSHGRVETPLPSNSPHDHMILRVEPGGLTWEVERSLPSNSPHDHMILRVELVGSHGRWKRPCLQTAHMTI
jgi:hypothetical protein